MEHYITPGEFSLLLGTFWLPIFGLASIPQWHFLAGRRRRFVWFLTGLVFEIALAFAIWLSPLHRSLVPSLDFLDRFSNGLSIGSIPLQAAILAALAVIFLSWVVGRQVAQPKHGAPPLVE